MKLMISLIGMVVLVIVGNLLKALILHRSRDTSWSMFLFLAAEVALYQIAAFFNIGIISGQMNEVLKAIGISASVLAAIVFFSGIGENGENDPPIIDEKTNNGRSADLIGEVIESEDRYLIIVKDYAGEMYEYTVEDHDGMEFCIFDKENREILSALRYVEGDNTFFISKRTSDSSDLLSEVVFNSRKNQYDLVTSWYEEDLRRIEVAAGGKIVLTIRFYDDMIGKECRIWIG